LDDRQQKYRQRTGSIEGWIAAWQWFEGWISAWFWYVVVLIKQWKA
jgi:hypothetical protein